MFAFFEYCIFLRLSDSEYRTFPKCRYALLACTSHQVQAERVVTCNDGSGADHLRQRELVCGTNCGMADKEGFLGITEESQGYLRVQRNDRRQKSSDSRVSIESRSSVFWQKLGTNDSNSFGSFNDQNLGVNVVLSDGQKCPPPMFTKNQKVTVIKAWKQIRLHIEQVETQFLLW